MSGRHRAASAARLGFAALLVLALLAIGSRVSEFFVGRAEQRAEALSDNLRVAKLAATSIGETIRGHVRLLDTVASRPDVAGVIAREEWRTADRFLKILRQIDPDLASAAVLDERGLLRARSPIDRSVVGEDFSFRDYFRGAMAEQGPYVSESFVQHGKPDRRVVALAFPLRSRGRVVGILQATLPVEAFLGVTREVGASSGETLEIYDQSGRVITGVDQHGHAHSSADHRDLSEHLHGDAGGFEFESSSGSRLIVSYAAVPQTGWTAVLHESPSSAYRIVNAVTRRLAVSGALVLLAAAAAWLTLRRLVRRYEHQVTYTESIVGSLAEGVVVTDTESSILFINPAMESLMGWSEDEVKGKSYTDAYPLVDRTGEQVPREQWFLTRALRTKEDAGSRGFDVYMCAKDGRHVPVWLTAAPMLDQDGNALGAVGIVRDVSREKEVDELKSSLVSTVSHELRTPLTMIQGFSELLLDQGLPDGQKRQALEHIHSSSERLAGLIEDLLSVSRIDSGRMRLAIQPVHLPTVITRTVEPYRDQSGRNICISIDEDVADVLADEDKLIRVITNLISNAIKYSPEGTEIEVMARTEDERVSVEVRDRGIGLNASEAKHIFEKFYRADRSDVQEVTGTGLGLYITKSLVELQGGEISVTSEPGHGSTFTLWLPRPPIEVEDEQQEEEVA